MAKELLRGFADNAAVMQAVKDVLLKHLSLDSLTGTEDDIKLGQLVRARLVGLKAVEEAWKEIAACKTYPPSPQNVNPAR